MTRRISNNLFSGMFHFSLFLCFPPSIPFLFSHGFHVIDLRESCNGDDDHDNDDDNEKFIER